MLNLMVKRKSSLPSRAWRLLRLALLWARKGGAFKLELRMFFKSIKSSDRGDSIQYFEREFSFDKTPLFNFNKSRRMTRLPCITPSVDFDDEGDDWIYCLNANEKKKEEEEISKNDKDGEILDCEEVEEVIENEKGIDLKAEEFIEKFYEEMKFQRQISLLQYNEMLHRGLS